MAVVIVALWVVGVACVIRGAALVSPALAWTAGGAALIVTMVWLLAQHAREGR